MEIKLNKCRGKKKKEKKKEGLIKWLTGRVTDRSQDQQVDN